MLEYGVELFKYHAEQRLRCFRYFTVMLTAIIVGGIVGTDRFLEKHECYPQAIPAMILICLFAIAEITLLFWLLDIRNRVLTERAEDGLKKTEDILFGETSDFKIVNNGVVA